MPMTKQLLTIQEFVNTVKISEIERLTVLRVYRGLKKTMTEWNETLSQYAFVEESIKPKKTVAKK